MIVFIRNIPGDTLRNEIVDFVQPAIKGGLFRAKGEIKKIEMLALKDKNINLTEYHALVHIEPDAVALRAIRKLHGQRFRNKLVTVRQYFFRNRKNDRRLRLKAVSAEIKEKRKNPDRRRDLEVIEGAIPQYSSRKSFNRRFTG